IEALRGERRRTHAARGWRTRVREANARRRVGKMVRHVVDESSIALGPADETDRCVGRQRLVDEAFGDIATLAAQRRALQIVRGLEAARIGLVRDDAHRARFGACAVQRALRARQCLDARDVVNMDVERALNSRDRLLVEIYTDAW